MIGPFGCQKDKAKRKPLPLRKSGRYDQRGIDCARQGKRIGLLFKTLVAGGRKGGVMMALRITDLDKPGGSPLLDWRDNQS